MANFPRIDPVPQLKLAVRVQCRQMVPVRGKGQSLQLASIQARQLLTRGDVVEADLRSIKAGRGDRFAIFGQCDEFGRVSRLSVRRLGQIDSATFLAGRVVPHTNGPVIAHRNDLFVVGQECGEASDHVVHPAVLPKPGDGADGQGIAVDVLFLCLFLSDRRLDIRWRRVAHPCSMRGQTRAAPQPRASDRGVPTDCAVIRVRG